MKHSTYDKKILRKDRAADGDPEARKHGYFDGQFYREHQKWLEENGLKPKRKLRRREGK